MSKPMTTTVETSMASAGSDPALAEPRDFFALLKPRVMSLVIFTAFVGLVAAPGTIHPVIGAAAIFCIALAAGASGALNMWYEADIDAKMNRTKNRPIPGGRIDRGSVLGFGLTLSIVSVAMMALMVNWLSAGLLAFTIFFYVVVYTMWLKRLTPQNIVIGGASGALPPVVAWAAVTNTVSIESLVLFAIIFIWTPPHFWSLSLFCSDDYERAGVPMLPVVAGEKETRNQIFIYSMLLAPLGVLPWAMGFAGSVYAIVSMTFGAVFMYLATRVWKDDGEEGEARKLFGFSIIYLFVLFAVIAGEALFEGLL